MDGQPVLDRLTILETRFIERWKSHDEQAGERQKLTCQKLDAIGFDVDEIKDSFTSLDKSTSQLVFNINERITTLPCEKRAGLYNQVKVMWGIMLLIVAAIIAEWIKK